MHLGLKILAIIAILGWANLAEAENVTSSREFSMGAILGASQLGQIGMEFEYRPQSWIGVVGGVGMELFNGSPYHNEARARLAVSSRLRKALSDTSAVGVGFGAWSGNYSLGRYTEDRAELIGAVALFGNAYIEKFYPSGFYLRFFVGGRALVHEGDCEGMGTSICDNPLSREHESGGFKQLGLSLGSSI